MYSYLLSETFLVLKIWLQGCHQSVAHQCASTKLMWPSDKCPFILPIAINKVHWPLAKFLRLIGVSLFYMVLFVLLLCYFLSSQSVDCIPPSSTEHDSTFLEVWLSYFGLTLCFQHNDLYPPPINPENCVNIDDFSSSQGSRLYFRK